MRHFNVLGAFQLAKIMQGFTMVGQMDIKKVGPMDIGKKLRAKAAADLAKWSIIISI